MQVEYVGPHAEVVVPDLEGEEKVEDVAVKRGQVVEVSDDLGRRLLEQPANWARPKARASKDEKED